MSPRELRYPVDRYLVESSKKFEMVNIVGEDIWNPEPALRPEDELVLRKLHEMLQSTADDLKLLSGELSKYHQTGTQYKTPLTPLDEEFNEKVHIEEVVNAKFHGYKIIDKTPRVPDIKPNVTNSFKSVNIKSKLKSSGVQVNSVPVNKKLSLSRTRVLQINEGNCDKSSNKKILNNSKRADEIDKVAYKEFSYKYVEPKVKTTTRSLQIQQMPSIDIRSELKEQKVLQLDILPEKKHNNDSVDKHRNVIVVSVQHETVHPPQSTDCKDGAPRAAQSTSKLQPTVRKISKMTTPESSSGSNNISSESHVIPPARKSVVSSNIKSPKPYMRNKQSMVVNKSNAEQNKRQKFSLYEWQKRLNDVYGPSISRKKNTTTSKNNSKKAMKTIVVSEKMNSADYIPYSKLTLGGVRVSDIEREISDIEDKRNIPLSPILNKIINSRENSFIKDSPRKSVGKSHQNILTTSDENLLQEVIDIEKTVSETLSKGPKSAKKQSKAEEPVIENISSLSDNEVAYDDDFEEEKSDASGNQKQSSHPEENPNKLPKTTISTHDQVNTHKATFTKTASLSIKESVDIFEFLHEIDTQDIAIQSTSNKITPKETQTSPRNEKQKLHPIHNDLWSSIDPRREVESMLNMEKDFIKKLIIEEYGDILEKSLDKPSTSKEQDADKNVAAFPKNTQTSPARVKSVMTSPTRTKTRTTSPLVNLPGHLSDQQTSPMIVVENADLKSDGDLASSINLSSPRFCLRLPQNSREVFSNLESSRDSSKRNLKQPKKIVRKPTTSTSSVDADNSSSELSSLGEVRIIKFRRFNRKVPSISEFSDSSSNCNSDYQTTSILPLRSEGEISVGQIIMKRTKTNVRSDGETSVVPLNEPDS